MKDELNMIGAIVLFNGTTPPEGWIFCDGQTLPFTTHHALSNVIDYKYGGSRSKTYALPKMSDVGSARYIICTEGYYPGF